MRKSTLILSILLTVAVLTLLFVLVSTYRRVVSTTAPGNGAQAQNQTKPQQQAQSTPNLGAAPTDGNVTIYAAAANAAKVLGRKDVYIAEYAQLNGTAVYLVTFLSGDLVYVGLDGQVISTSKKDPISASVPTSHR